MIVISVALEKEIPPLFMRDYSQYWVRFDALRSGRLHHYLELPYLVVVTGVGKASFFATQWLIEHLHPSEIVNIGTAGSTTYQISNWVMLQSATCHGHHLNCLLKTQLPIPYHLFHFGRGITVNDINPDVSGDAIDMEAFHMAAACQSKHIPFSSIKYITDYNNSNTQMDFNKNLDHFHHAFWELLSHLLLPSSTVSAIIPTFNRAQQTTVAIESVLNQSRPPNEIIVVDDGSTDPFDYHHELVHVIRLNENHGVSYARNIGIKFATSDWISLLDSDDIWHPIHLECMFEHIRFNPLCRWLQTDERWVRNGLHFNKKSYHEKPSGWGFEPSLKRCLVSPSAVMIHCSLFELHGVFDESLTVCEDYDLWLRILRYVPIDFVPRVTMTKFGGHVDQLSTSFPAMDNFRLTALMKQWTNRWPNIDRQDLRSVIQNKCYILKKGALKRGLPTDHYDAINHMLLCNR